jgi:hypothetical protein
MSAIGSGVTIICGNQLDGFAGSPPPAGVREAMVPITLNAGDQITVSHFVGRKAWQVLITDADGNIQTTSDFTVSQTLLARPLPDTIQIDNVFGGTKTVFIAIRWQENSVEASLIPVNSLDDEEGSRSSTVGNVTVTIENITPPDL